MLIPGRLRGSIAAIAGIAAILTSGCTITVATGGPTSSPAAAQANLVFSFNARAMGTPSRHALAGTTTSPSGAQVTLWVSAFAGTNTKQRRCYEVSVERPRTGSGSFDCLVPGPQVELLRLGAVTWGSVGTREARSVTVRSGGRSAKLPVTAGFFLIPERLATGPSASYAITVVGSRGQTLLKVSGVKPTPPPVG